MKRKRRIIKEEEERTDVFDGYLFIGRLL